MTVSFVTKFIRKSFSDVQILNNCSFGLYFMNRCRSCKGLGSVLGMVENVNRSVELSCTYFGNVCEKLRFGSLYDLSLCT